MKQSKDKRIGELEDELKDAKRRMEDLRRERDAADNLVKEQDEHLDNMMATRQQWIDAYDMVLNDKDEYCWQEGLIQQSKLWYEKYAELRKKWNRFVGEYNATVRQRNIGRPLAAGPGQVTDVLKRHKAGQSLRDIAEDTNLGLRTVRTIIDKRDGVDRATIKRLERIAPDKIAEARERMSQKLREGLPSRINADRKRGAELRKAAKGLRYSR